MKIFANVDQRLYEKVDDIIEKLKLINYSTISEEESVLYRCLKRQLLQIRRLQHNIHLMRFEVD